MTVAVSNVVVAVTVIVKSWLWLIGVTISGVLDADVEVAEELGVAERVDEMGGTPDEGGVADEAVLDDEDDVVAGPAADERVGY